MASKGTYTDRIHLTWSAAPRAVRYYVYRADSSGGPYSQLPGEDSVTVKDVMGVSPGVHYWFRVAGVDGMDQVGPLSSPDEGWTQTGPAPMITGRQTRDVDSNGQIDRIRVQFSQAIADATVVYSEFTVAGYTVVNRDTGITSNDAEIFIHIVESGTPDTDAKPAVRYIGTTLTNGSGVPLAAEAAATAAEDDAPPVLLSAVSTRGSKALLVTFSEPVFTDPTGGILAASDFSYTNGSAGGATSIAGLAESNGGDASVTVTVNSAFMFNDFSPYGTFDDAIGAASNQIFDEMDNAASTATVALTYGAGAPVVLAGGDLYQDTTLTGQVYLVDYTIAVPAGITLTIEAGATLIFRQDQGIVVAGVLSAQGSMSNPILFTGELPIRGYWYGIEYYDTASYSNSLNHVTVEYGGAMNPSFGAAANVMLTSNGYPVRASITNSTLRESAGYGFFFHYYTEQSPFSLNVSTANTLGPGLVGGVQAGYLDSDSDYTGNDTDVITVAQTAITVSCTWRGLNVPYYLPYYTDVTSSMTIMPGATLIFAQDTYFGIGYGGSLTAVGTSTDGIVFTAKSPLRGYWIGLIFNNTNSTNNKLQYATIEYGGAGSWLGNVQLTSSGLSNVQVDIRDCVIQHGNHYGVYADPLFCSVNSDMLTTAGNTFSDNTDGAYLGP